MRVITVSEIFQFAYGPTSTLKNRRTWWGRPLYTVEVIQERLAAAEGFRVVRYPSGKAKIIRGPDSLSQEQVEAIVLAGEKPEAPRLDILETIAEYWQTMIFLVLVATASVIAAFVIRPIIGY